MASNKKSSNTSKTAHVMNLLSRNRGAAPEADAAAGEASAAEQQAAPQTAAVPSLISSLNADSEISSQIKSALEDSLDTQAPAPVPAQETPAATEEPAATAEQEPAVDQTPEMSEETAASSSAAEGEGSVDPVEAPSESDKQPEVAAHDITYINVMQTLVEEKARKYMEMSGLCTCDRCVADVKALALNGLMPKYVVMNAGEMVPRITLYDGRFSAEVTSQILRACETVKKRPHHHR